MVVSDIDKEANTLEDSVGYAENFNKTKAITGISRKVGHSNSCLDFHFFWKSDLKVSQSSIKEMSTGKGDICPDVSISFFFKVNNILKIKIFSV